MSKPIEAYEFAEGSFYVGSDPVTCVIAMKELRQHVTVAELNHAFSGYARYKQLSWMGKHFGGWIDPLMGFGGKHFVGVWGKRNCQRLRRFLRERGADVVLVRERPANLRLTFRSKSGVRRKVRSLR